MSSTVSRSIRGRADAPDGRLAATHPTVIARAASTAAALLVVRLAVVRLVVVRLVVVAVVVVALVLGAGVGPVRAQDVGPSSAAAAQSAAASAAPSAPAAPSASAAPSALAAPSAPGVRRSASGLPWDSGVFSHDAARTSEFARSRGRAVDVLAVFPTRDSWETILQDWWMSPTAVPADFTGTLAVGVPLFPSDGSFEAAAAGADSARWEELGRLIAARYPDAYVRPGWEFNIPNWPWATTPDTVPAYRQAFRHAALGLRRGGPELRIVFNPNEGRGGSLPDASLAYPGDDVVDVVGIDAYDWYPAYRGSGWDEHRSKDQGWDYWADFARAHGKRFALPEWGVMTGSDASGGDNPDYIEHVMTWMAEHADLMAFDAYFEETQDYCRCALSQNPRAAAAYAAALPMLPTLRAAPAARPAVSRSPGVADPPAAGPAAAPVTAGGPELRRRPGRGRPVGAAGSAGVDLVAPGQPGRQRAQVEAGTTGAHGEQRGAQGQ